MKYLVYSNTGLSSKQIGLTAQFVADCHESGDELKIVQCDNVLTNCIFNPVHNQIACAICQSRSQVLYNQIGLKSDDFIKLKATKFDYKVPNFSNLDELMNYNYEGINVGRGAASSILSYYKDYQLNSKKYGEIIELELRKAINVYLNFKEILNREKPDKVILFNGRFSEVMPLFDYCSVNNQDFSVLEAGAQNKYELYENCFPHSIKYRTKITEELWDKEPNVELKEKVGHDWFVKKRFGDETFDKSYLKNQEKGKLPKTFDKNKRNILILNSSEDEMKVIKEWKSKIFENQNSSVELILQHFIENKKIHFFLRAHPNLDVPGNIQMEELYSMDYPNLTIIKPNEEIDTYAMIDSCEKTITFGSTAGIEATYWGRPSILIGKAYHSLMDNTAYKPESFEEVFNLIEDEKLKSMSQNACLPYGYYYSNVGKESKDFVFNGLNNSTFKGKRIKKWYPSTFLFLIRYSVSVKKWFFAYKAFYGKRLNLKDLFRYRP